MNRLKLFPMLVIILFSISLAQTIEVSGAGSNFVDGTYTASGTYNGKTKYVMDVYHIVYSTSQWKIAMTGNYSFPYYYHEDDGDKPPAGGWNVGVSGSPPAPGLSGDVLPVELVSFEGIFNGESVKLTWETATEINNYGFNVECAINNLHWETKGFVCGFGTTNSPKQYSYSDSDLPYVSEVNYRLKQIDNDGAFNYSKEITIDLSTITYADNEIKYSFSLNQNYPNPFNPTTNIKFTLPSLEQSQYAELAVYNTLGKKISTLFSGIKSAGNYEVTLDASTLSSGVYFYKLTYGRFTSTKKLMLVK